jgi:hypothetical protein
MDIITQPKSKTITEWDFFFLNGEKLSVTLEHSKSDTCTPTESGYILLFYNEDGSVRETVEIVLRNLCWTSNRTRDIAVLDPKNNPVTQRVQELMRARNRTPTPASQE